MKFLNLTHEKTTLTPENMSDLQTPLFVAKEMGEKLGER